MELLFLIFSVIGTITVAWFVKWYFFSYYIPGIPIKKANSILGYSTTTDSKKGKYDSHLIMMQEVESTGKLFQYYYLGHLVVMINDKYISKYVLERINGKGFFHRGNPKINHRSIFNLDSNADWKKRRMAYRPSFSMLSLKHFQPEMRLLSQKLCSILTEHAGNGKVLEIDKTFGTLTVDVICSIAFQYDMHALENSPIYQQLHEDIRVRFESTWLSVLPFAYFLYHLPTKFTNRYRESTKNLRAFCLTILQHVHKLSEEGRTKKESLAQALVDLSKEEGVTEDDMCHDILTLFIAGHETTAHTLSFFVYALATHPDVQSKCHAAIDDCNATTASGAAGDSSASTMALLPPYVEAVLKESMRKYPVANRGSMRLIKEEGGFVLPKELLNKSDASFKHTEKQLTFDHDITLPQSSWILTFAHYLHNGSANWGEKADEFIPERFLAEGHFTGSATACAASGSAVNPLSSPAIYGGGGVEADDLLFCPFAYGLRNCVGMNLSLMELRMVIAELLKNFSFRLADESLKDEKMLLETVFTLRPSKMLPVYVSRRK